MKEIAWVFGTSASGKNSFINHVTSAEGEPLKRRLGWQDVSVVACQESLEYIGQYHHDPITERRVEIIDAVKRLIEENEVVLIKWQEVDAKSDLSNRLKASMPDAQHRALVLEVDDETLKQRLPKKLWWNEDIEIDSFIAKERKKVADAVEAFDYDGEPIRIDSSNENYEIIN